MVVVVIVIVVVVVVVVIVDDAPFIANADSVNDTPIVVPSAPAFMMLTHADTMIILKKQTSILPTNTATTTSTTTTTTNNTSFDAALQGKQSQSQPQSQQQQQQPQPPRDVKEVLAYGYLIHPPTILTLLYTHCVLCCMVSPYILSFHPICSLSLFTLSVYLICIPNLFPLFDSSIAPPICTPYCTLYLFTLFVPPI